MAATCAMAGASWSLSGPARRAVTDSAGSSRQSPTCHSPDQDAGSGPTVVQGSHGRKVPYSPEPGRGAAVPAAFMSTPSWSVRGAALKIQCLYNRKFQPVVATVAITLPIAYETPVPAMKLTITSVATTLKTTNAPYLRKLTCARVSDWNVKVL